MIEPETGSAVPPAAPFRSPRVDRFEDWLHAPAQLESMHPRDTGGSFLEIDFQKGGEDISGPWEPAGKDFHKAIRTDVVRGIAAAEIQSRDPKDLAERWSKIIEIPVRPDKAGNPSLSLENATIRFVKDIDGLGEGLGGLDLIAVNRVRALETATALTNAQQTVRSTSAVCA